MAATGTANPSENAYQMNACSAVITLRHLASPCVGRHHLAFRERDRTRYVTGVLHRPAHPHPPVGHSMTRTDRATRHITHIALYAVTSAGDGRRWLLTSLATIVDGIWPIFFRSIEFGKILLSEECTRTPSDAV